MRGSITCAERASSAAIEKSPCLGALSLGAVENQLT